MCIYLSGQVCIHKTDFTVPRISHILMIKFAVHGTCDRRQQERQLTPMAGIMIRLGLTYP